MRKVLLNVVGTDTQYVSISPNSSYTSSPVDASKAIGISLTVEAQYGDFFTGEIALEVYSSLDGVHFDTIPITGTLATFTSSRNVVKTIRCPYEMVYYRVTVLNKISNIYGGGAFKVFATHITK